MLYYCPLEPYRERYTMQLSAAKVGWLERNWIKKGIEYTRVEGRSLYEYRHESNRVRNGGVVLDPVSRSVWAMGQVERLLLMAEKGKITSEDVIYFDDFWHPGLEALAYTFHLLKTKPKMYAYCWAQSVDEYDFTCGMIDWIRSYERGNGAVLDGVFVANTLLKKLLYEHAVCAADKVHVVGLPFDSEEVLSRMTCAYRNGLAHPGLDPMPERANIVVFSSRWDKEKNPKFFLDVAKYVHNHTDDKLIRFVVCSSAPDIKSNDPDCKQALLRALCDIDGPQVLPVSNLTKEVYYQLLIRAKVQFNCASQDWTSFTLLEASVAGCVPVYPNFRSFPEVFGENWPTYKHLDVRSAGDMVLDVLSKPDLWTAEAIQERSWIHRRFDDTYLRMLKVMGLTDEEVAAPYPV